MKFGLPPSLRPIILIHSAIRPSGSSGATQGGRNSIDGRKEAAAKQTRIDTKRDPAEVFALSLVFDRRLSALFEQRTLVTGFSGML